MSRRNQNEQRNNAFDQENVGIIPNLTRRAGMSGQQEKNPKHRSETKDPQKQAQEKKQAPDDDAVLADINEDAEKTRDQRKR